MPVSRRILVVVLCLLVFCTPCGWCGEAERLVILHINDTHGRMEGDDGGGGAARLATVLKAARREERGRVVFLHAGDLLSRGNALTVYYGGKVNYQLWNRLKVDAYTPGNGEFYFGVPNLLAQVPHARFPVLHANIAFKDTGARLFEPTCVVERAGLRVGVLGAGFVRMTHPGAAPLDYRDPVAEAARYVPELRRSCDVVVVLSHCGPGTDLKIAEAVSGADFILGGHDHSNPEAPATVPWPDGGGTAYLVRAGDYFKRLGRLDVTLSREGGAVSVASVAWRFIELDETVAEDAGTLRFLARRRRPLEALKVCRLDAPVAHPETGPSPMGALAAEAVRVAAGAEAALLDRGSVVAGLPAGAVGMTDVLAAHPYRNGVVWGEMPGAALEVARAEAALFYAGPEAIEPDRNYRVAMGDYGQGTVKALREVVVSPSGVRVDEALAAWLVEHEDAL